MECGEDDCERRVAVGLHIPRRVNLHVCPAHARIWAQKDGVVPAPIEGEEDRWP